jgi:hypothetical protein
VWDHPGPLVGFMSSFALSSIVVRISASSGLSTR